MKGFCKFIRKIMKNDEHIYEKENGWLKELGTFCILLLVCLALLVFPLGRLLLEWASYVSTGCLIVLMICVCLSNIFAIWRSFRYAKKLEKLGTSVEEEEMARRALCEAEGDDGLPPK